MQQLLLKNQIISWLRSQPYWLQFAGNQLLEGADVSDELTAAAYNLFKEDSGLKAIGTPRPVITFNEVEVNQKITSDQLYLQQIKDLENVNALANRQSITIGEHLTLIYGANGAGKSGYIRLLNNTFISRGDKQILPDVFSGGSSGAPTCKFTFQSPIGNYDLEYPSQKRHTEFSQFAVYDTQSVKVHLEQDNKLNFTPVGFEFFEKALSLYETLKSKLNEEIKNNRKPNEFEKFFVNDNNIKLIMNNLGAASDVNEIKALSAFTTENEATISTLTAKKETLKRLNISQKIEALHKQEKQLFSLVEKQKALSDCLKQEDVEECKKLIASYHEFRNLATREGIKGLDSYNIEGLDSAEWKEFIKAAKSYASVLESRRKADHHYPSEGDNCLFCLQPLKEKEITLVNSYWTLLKSQAESALITINKRLTELERKIKAQEKVLFDETSSLFEFVTTVAPELINNWKTAIATAENQRQAMLLFLENKVLTTDLNNTGYLLERADFIVGKIKNEITQLVETNTEKEIAELELQIKLLTDKGLLNKLLDGVLAYIAGYKWAAKAEACLSAFNTKSITVKQGELFGDHITNKYTNTFDEECKKLDAPANVNIIQRNAKGATLRKLQVGGTTAASILSEGEQRAISLADFITEVQLNPINKGVFLDDPVTSLDHLRREKIAQRLVDLSKDKQVIIFTHDIAFFLQVISLTETAKIKPEITTIRNINGTPGIIIPKIPWIAKNVKERLGYLKDSLVKLKKTEREGDADAYFEEVKLWYGLLRETWERAVEERLFKGVIERFNLGVQTLKLKKLDITEELISEIEKGMTESSIWVHDAGAGLNPTPPDTTKAEHALTRLTNFAAKCTPA